MRLLALLLLALSIEAQEHGQFSGEARNRAIGDPASIAAGAKLYATSCAGCHGPDGSGGRGPNLIHRAASNPLSDRTLFSTIRDGLPGTDMPPTKLPDDQTWNLVAFIRVLTGPAVQNTVPGDPSAGERIFWGEKGGCSDCHAIRGRGSRMGPDLSNIGGSRPLALIREDILQPSKDLSYAGKEAVTVALKDGETIKGIARNRSNYSLQVVDSQGNLHLISMTDIKKLAVLDHSLMPEDYGKRLSADELRDLLAYLAHQSVRPADSGSEKTTDPQ